MKCLVIGGGGREHAIVWKLRQSPRVSSIVCAPGNGGIAEEAECVAVEAADVSALVALAERIAPDLTVVGPEVSLVNGVVDAFTARHWPIVGPSKQAAQLEGSKIFTKKFLERHGIPTAHLYGYYDSAEAALRALDRVEWPVVIKADGLCAGKGVLVAPGRAAAADFITRLMDQNDLGEGGRRIMMEEALDGLELSFIIVTDGKSYAPLAPTRDHKRVFDNDEGPNTGGMGAFSSDHLLSAALRETVISKLVEPTLKGLAADGIPYQGFLYFGLMLTKSGPKVLEFNCRLGDPEAQAITARMDFDFAEMLADVAAGQLQPEKLRWKVGASACVVLTSGGYPGKFAAGKRIEGLTTLSAVTGVKVLHAATRREGANTVTSGGRVLGVTAAADSLEAALEATYQAVAQIHFDGMHYRHDIGRPAGRGQAVGDK